VNLLDIAIVAWGLYELFGITVKPAFYWERSRRMQLARTRLGDQNTTILYLVLSLLLVGFGLWSLFLRGG
jgi:predicted transporter